MPCSLIGRTTRFDRVPLVGLGIGSSPIGATFDFRDEAWCRIINNAQALIIKIKQNRKITANDCKSFLR